MKKAKNVNSKNKKGVEELVSFLENSSDIILIDYRGLSVSELTKIRKEAKSKGALLKISKNNLLKIALKEKNMPDLGDNLLGPTAVFFSSKDTNAIAKILFTAKSELQDKFKVKCGIVSGEVFDSSQLEAYSKLPSRDEMLAMLMGTMNAPVQNTVGVMTEVISTFMRTLDAYKESKN